MEIPESVVREAWERSGGRCECRNVRHNHPNIKCDRQLIWENRDIDRSQGAWKICVKPHDGQVTADLCEVLCCECYHLKRIHQK